MAITVNHYTGFEPDKNLLAKLLKVHKDTLLFKDAMAFVNIKKDLIKPKFILKRFEIYKVYDTGLVIGDIKLNSKTLVKMLNINAPIFVFAGTGGKEIELYADDLTDYFEKYVLDQMAYMGCLYSLEAMRQTLKNTYKIENYISFAPGSLPDWDVIETKKIFELMGEEYKKIGLRILDSGMVDPLKTISGILFESNDVFNSCQLCNRENCPTRLRNYVSKLQI